MSSSALSLLWWVGIKAAGTRVVSGETYFLCSQTCLDALDQDAAMYAHPRVAQPAHHHARQ